MIRLTNPSHVEEARSRIRELLEGRAGWFCAEGRGGARVEVRRGEWDVRAEHGALFLTFWGAKGARTWRVAGWAWAGGRLFIEATRRAGAEREVLEFVPRASAAEGVAAVASARRERCERLAEVLCEAAPGARIQEARLSFGARRGEPGRYARVRLRKGDEAFCATGPVVPLGPEEADAFLSSALLWFERLRERPKDAPRRMWLAARRALAAATAERLALLRDELRGAIDVFEIDDDLLTLEPVRKPSLRELIATSPRAFHPAGWELSETARRVISLAPDAIDVVRARGGETLRFRGLAFVRVRRLMGKEGAWFGAEDARRRRVLDETSLPDFDKLLGELAEHRRADAPDRRHALYRAAPEAWLESILRRDVTRLDPGLRLAPLYSQFRTARGRAAGARPVDLLALRRDGRLVVIELKVSEDAALPLQGADYWRRVSAHHRAGHIRRACLFGDAEIADGPPLVYLAAPMLSFHRSFRTLARCVAPEIEMYRIDLNEDWRAGVRVARLVTLTNDWQ